MKKRWFQKSKDQVVQKKHDLFQKIKTFFESNQFRLLRKVNRINEQSERSIIVADETIEDQVRNLSFECFRKSAEQKADKERRGLKNDVRYQESGVTLDCRF